MGRSFRLFFAVTLIFSFAQNAHTKTADKSAKVTKLLDLQANINGARNSERMVASHIKFAEKDPKTKVLKDPAVANRLINEIEQAYINEMAQKLSEKEVDYLLSLYVSPMYQHYITLEKDFWNKKAPGIMKEKISLYQKKAPKK